MKKTNDNMTIGSLPLNMLFFCIPLIFSNLLQILFNMCDIAVVGRFAGSSSLGSVGSAATLVTLFTGIIIGIGSGVNVLTARYLGEDAKDKVMKTVHSSLFICFFAGIILMICGILLAKPMLRLFNTRADLLDGAALYIRIYFLGMPALGIYNFGNAVLSAAGDTKKPLYYLSVAGVVNIILNLVLVIVFKLDVAGVAIASVAAQYVSAFLVLINLSGCNETYGLYRSSLHITADVAKKVLHLGLPTGFQFAIFAIANLFVQMGINSFGSEIVAGNAAACNADSIAYEVMAAIYMACTSFMSRNYGAKKYERVIKSYFWGLLYSLGFTAVFGVCILLFGKSFLSVFTNDPAVISAGMDRIKIMSFSYCVSTFMDCTIAASRGLGKTIVPTAIVIMGSCVFRIVWIYTVFAYFKTIESIYLLYIFSWALTAVAEILYFVHIYRKMKEEISYEQH